MACERHLQETLGLVASMSELADRLGADCENDACLVLAGVIRDSVSTIRCAAAQPRVKTMNGLKAADRN